MGFSSVKMDFLGQCWRETSRKAPKRARSLCDIALGIGDGHIMPMPFADECALPTWDIAVPPEPTPAPKEQAAVCKVASEAGAPRLKGRSSRLPPSAEDALNRAAVLRSWLSILDTMGDKFAIVADETVWTEEVLEPYLATRRTGTLAVHASSWRCFLKYAADAAVDPKLLAEPVAHEYFKHLKSTGAPASRAASFLKACNFAFGILSFRRGNEIALSARCKGLAAQALKGKRRRLQRDALKAAWVHSLETAVADAAVEQGPLSLQEAVVAGFLLFSAHTRSRCSDASRIVAEPVLEEADDNDPECSFLEAVTTGAQIKTGNTSTKADLSLPVVALSRGISDTPWGAAWLDLRGRLFLDAADDESLMLEPLADGSFGEGRIQAGQATTWLRFLLIKLGVPPAELTNVGSHSCKATILSMTAKAGFSRDTRRTLGGHAVPGDSSVDIYSRDSLSAPLLEVGRLFTKIRAKLFDPDASRSGRWRKAASPMLAADYGGCEVCRATLQPNDPIFKCSCGGWIHLEGPCAARCLKCNMDICRVCDEENFHECPDNNDLDDLDLSDPSSSSDGEQADMVAQEAEATLEGEHRELVKGEEGGADAAFPTEGIFVHKIYHTAHKLRDAHFTACGVPASQLKYDFFYEGGDVPRKHLCWRSGCAPWTAPACSASSADATVPAPRARRKLK